MERIALIGGGIGALAAALSLRNSGRELVIVERDPAPPDIPADTAFEGWQRPGVPQFKHAHAFLARAHAILRKHHPEVLQELLETGMKRGSFRQGVAEGLGSELGTNPADNDLLLMWGRRATFEYVLRRHVGALPNVRFVHGARVVGLLSERSKRRLCVTGLRLDDGQEIHADVVIDASGKHTKAPGWLRAEGVRVEVKERPSDFIYACRHYRFDDPATPPDRHEATGSLDYLGYATFFAEGGHFAIAFSCPADDLELGRLMQRQEGFERLAAQFPVLSRLTRAARPTSKVLGAGNFCNRWTTYGARGGVKLLGFFAVGDSLLETNPMFGRGCSSALIQAQALAEILIETQDLLYHYFELCTTTDRMMHMRARLRRGQPVPLGDRIFSHLFDTAYVRAHSRSALVAREHLKAEQMLEVSPLGLRIAMLFHILGAWLHGLFERTVARISAQAPTSVPPRREFLRRLMGSASMSDEPPGRALEP